MQATVDKVKKARQTRQTQRELLLKSTGFTLVGIEAEHTLTMFYMERGMWESNMMITFNFPDENEFAVEKQVDKSKVNPCLPIPLRMPPYSPLRSRIRRHTMEQRKQEVEQR